MPVAYLCVVALAVEIDLALDSVINYDCKWRHNMKFHLKMTLKAAFKIVMCL